MFLLYRRWRYLFRGIRRPGSLVLHAETDRLGRHSWSTDGMWTQGGWESSFLRDPDGWANTVISGIWVVSWVATYLVVRLPDCLAV